MYCPFCQALETKVLDSRLVQEGAQVKRRRACSACGGRFNTFERVECVMPRVLKRDGQVVSFEEAKLRSGLLRAFKKRPLSNTQFEDLMAEILKSIRQQSGKEITSLGIGEVVMSHLRCVDAIAYIRFVSVYNGFSDIDAFRELLTRLEADKIPLLSNEADS